MSVTLLSLAMAALPAILDAAGQYLQENRGAVKAAIKQATPGIREETQKLQDTISGEDYRKAGWTKTDEETLIRSYALPSDKSLTGLSQAVYAFFRNDILGSKVSLEHDSYCSNVITCATDSVLKASGLDKKASSLAASAMGFDVKITVSLTQLEDKILVEYGQYINDEAMRAVKAIAYTNPVLGICKLYGINERHQIPFKLKDAMEAYLRA